MDEEEIFEVNIDDLMARDFTCHRCLEEGVEQTLVKRYYIEPLNSYRQGKEKYLGVAEQGCPRTEHLGVEIRFTEEFYS